MRKVELHGLSYLDAVCMAITFMESLYKKDEQAKLRVEWRRLATEYGIEIELDPELAAAQARRTQAKLEGLFGPASG